MRNIFYYIYDRITGRFKKRKLRMAIGGKLLDFLDYKNFVTETDKGVEVLFNYTLSHERRKLFNDFMCSISLEQRIDYNPQLFKKRFGLWCKYRGLDFDSYEKDGKEYLIVLKLKKKNGGR